MSFFGRLKLLFTCGPELESILEEKKRAREAEERENNRYRLELCFKHRQEQHRSHYAEHNCDHCKLLKELEELKK